MLTVSKSDRRDKAEGLGQLPGTARTHTALPRGREAGGPRAFCSAGSYIRPHEWRLQASDRRVLRLPAGERAAVIGQLLARLQTTPNPDIEAAWAEETARREQDDQSADIAWEDLHAELSGKPRSGE